MSRTIADLRDEIVSEVRKELTSDRDIRMRCVEAAVAASKHGEYEYHERILMRAELLHAWVIKDAEQSEVEP